jgi:hypothetical protein
MEKSILSNVGEVELFTRKEVAGLLKIGISSLDLIPESELIRVKIGKSVRFSKESIFMYIKKKESKIIGKNNEE